MTKTAKVISFVDKQRQVTQQRYQQLESSFAEMMAAIEDNAQLQLNLHDLTLEVMQCTTLAQAVNLLITGLIARFALHDVQLWSMPDYPLAQPIPTEGVCAFLQHMQAHRVEFGTYQQFPSELWGRAGVRSAAAFQLSAHGCAYAVLLLGRDDDQFSECVDVLFLQQFVQIMGLWLAQLMSMDRT